MLITRAAVRLSHIAALPVPGLKSLLESQPAAGDVSRKRARERNPVR